MLCNSRKVDILKQITIQAGDENRAGFQAISSQFSPSIKQIGAENRSGLLSISSQLTQTESTHDARYHPVHTLLNDQAQSSYTNSQKLDEIS